MRLGKERFTTLLYMTSQIHPKQPSWFKGFQASNRFVNVKSQPMIHYIDIIILDQ